MKSLLRSLKSPSSALAILLAGTMSASAVSFDIVSLESNGDPDAPTSWFDVNLAVNNIDGTATFSISNLVAVGNGTKISDIWLGTQTGTKKTGFTNNFFSYFVEGSGVLGGTGTTNFSIDEDPNDNVGGVPWGVQVNGDPVGANDSSLINPGETLTITYDLVNAGTMEQDLINAFLANPQELGIAFHVQSIAGGYSEKYEAFPGGGSDVPDGGTTALLLGLSLVGFAGLRKLTGSREA